MLREPYLSAYKHHAHLRVPNAVVVRLTKSIKVASGSSIEVKQFPVWNYNLFEELHREWGMWAWARGKREGREHTEREREKERHTHTHVNTMNLKVVTALAPRYYWVSRCGYSIQKEEYLYYHKQLISLIYLLIPSALFMFGYDQSCSCWVNLLPKGSFWS